VDVCQQTVSDFIAKVKDDRYCTALLGDLRSMSGQLDNHRQILKKATQTSLCVYGWVPPHPMQAIEEHLLSEEDVLSVHRADTALKEAEALIKRARRMSGSPPP
jgi:hypothetical protein